MAHPYHSLRGDKVEKSRVDRIVKGYASGGAVSEGKSSSKGSGRTNVNIIISPSGGDAGKPPMPMPGPMPGPMAGPPAGGPPAMPPNPPMPPMMPAGGGPPGLAPRPFKSGGRVNLDAGAGGGLGRIEKAKAAKRK